MATGSAQDEQGLPKDELQQLRREFQLVVEQGQASMMLAMRDMMAEFMRNKDRSESSSAGSSAAGREGPRGAEPSAVRTSVAAGGVAGDTAAGRETTLRGDASRNLGATGRREVAVPVEVGPARASLTSQGGLANGMHSQDASPGAAQELLQLQLRQQASPGAAKELRHQQ